MLNDTSVYSVYLPVGVQSPYTVTDEAMARREVYTDTPSSHGGCLGRLRARDGSGVLLQRVTAPKVNVTLHAMHFFYPSAPMLFCAEPIYPSTAPVARSVATPTTHVNGRPHLHNSQIIQPHPVSLPQHNNSINYLILRPVSTSR